MTAAAQTSEPANPTTGAVRPLATVRWLVALLLVHWLIGCARNLIAGLQLGPTDPDDTFLLRHFGTTDPAVILPRVTRALRRATALEADLRARRPTEQGFSTETCRAVAAEMIAICRDLGILRGAPARIIRNGQSVATRLSRLQRRFFPLTLIPPTTAAPATCVQPTACPGLRAGATGPPASQPHHIDADTDAGVPWNFSRRTPASFLLYAFP